MAAQNTSPPPPTLELETSAQHRTPCVCVYVCVSVCVCVCVCACEVCVYACACACACGCVVTKRACMAVHCGCTRAKNTDAPAADEAVPAEQPSREEDHTRSESSPQPVPLVSSKMFGIGYSINEKKNRHSPRTHTHAHSPTKPTRDDRQAAPPACTTARPSPGTCCGRPSRSCLRDTWSPGGCHCLP